MTGMSPGKKKTHRGKRGGRGKGKPTNPHHAQAQTHLADALKAGTPQDAHGHLFKALTALNKARAGSPQPSSGVMTTELPPAGPSATPGPQNNTPALFGALDALQHRKS